MTQRFFSSTVCRFVTLGVVVAVVCLSTPNISSADEVFLKPERPGGEPAMRTGEIVDYTGRELKLTTISGRTESIPTERILSVRTAWSQAHQTGLQQLAAGNLDEAINSFREAARGERRRWVLRQLQAELISCSVARGDYAQAGNDFLALMADDPQSLHAQVIPVPWRNLPVSPDLEAQARKWVADVKNPYAQLLGASWLLGTAARNEAATVLTNLSNGTDKAPALLAEVQLWRTKLLAAKLEDVERWEGVFDRLTDDQRPAACYILGDAWGRLNEPKKSATYYLQVPILYSSNRAIAADALLAAGKQLDQSSQASAAAGLYREVLRRFPGTDAAASAKARIPATTNNSPSSTGAN